MKLTINLPDGRVLVVVREEYDEPSDDPYPRRTIGPPRATLDGVHITAEEAAAILEQT